MKKEWINEINTKLEFETGDNNQKYKIKRI